MHNEMVLNRYEKKNDPRRRRIMRYLHLKKKKKKKKTTTKKTKRRRGMSRNSTTNKTSFALPNKPPPLTVVIHQKILSMPCLTRKLSFSQTTNIGVDMCVGCSLSLSLSLVAKGARSENGTTMASKRTRIYVETPPFGFVLLFLFPFSINGGRTSGILPPPHRNSFWQRLRFHLKMMHEHLGRQRGARLDARKKISISTLLPDNVLQKTC